MKRIIFLHAEGIGNVVQAFPCIRTLTEVLGYKVDFCHLFGSFNIPKEIIPYINKFLHISDLSTIDVSQYDGKVATAWVSNYLTAGNLSKLPLLSKIYSIKMDVSEVDTYMNIARDLGAKEELLWEATLNIKPSNKKYDVVIANGYNTIGSANWVIKSYPYYKEVAKILFDNNLKVASIGNGTEYVKGTINETGLSLIDSIKIIKGSKCLLSNDTGSYHLSNLVGIKNFVIFTATSIKKNYDKRFHKYSNLIYRDDLKCRPCQASRLWNTTCKKWECRNISPEFIVKKILKDLN